jgi:predicted amidohydrolase
LKTLCKDWCEIMRIALLHLAPIPGDLDHNRRLVETAIAAAARAGADWIITPELCVCGYDFADRIGTDWIAPQPDPWMDRLRQRIAQLRVTVFLAVPERDARTGALHNAAFAISADGTILGRHRKINTLRVGAEAWSSPGTEARPIPVPPWGGAGVMICADAYTPGIAASLQAQGARALVSPAAWCPEPYGPNGEWEQRARDTGLPLFVCNRTGLDGSLDFTQAQSVVVNQGRRLLTFQSADSAVFVVDWDWERQALTGTCTVTAPV